MDLQYLKEHPAQLPVFIKHQRIRETPVPGGSICAAQRLTFDDGGSVFCKSLPDPPDGFFAAEAAGLRWLREAGAVPVPELIVELPDLLALEWIEHGEATPEGAERFGRRLAALHRAGAPAFGAPWPGFIGTAPLPNDPSDGAWGPWFAQRRLLPFLRTSIDNGALTSADVTGVERVIAGIEEYGGAEPPSRIHGDLWPGNLLWDRAGDGWLVDPAAHGGHRETDLALLGLWGGAPHYDRILAAYREAAPLSDGWRERVPLHRLYLLLVHTALFGASFQESVRSTLRAL
ncbi:fructosamine kinase family protein [Dactylosporangium aurantiacum]|uniref:Fructosamine kinase family protein n=1 Tax=Dactylosporangium aurantiacum TaxID=35754 RepID=A0A9Q9IJS6_9ACTN|nr:fructosamine kinase family protein [Dactylosporangium aurantiacum]MDG6101312.1 fructosamine kinase family protein [Dactylosporangium aurantiacum]UWZ54679.1 fructosamine kinase family protein [Dactylosporangium aurantiacum]